MFICCKLCTGYQQACTGKELVSATGNSQGQNSKEDTDMHKINGYIQYSNDIKKTKRKYGQQLQICSKYFPLVQIIGREM